MRTKILFSILVVAFCALGVKSWEQSFVKTYTDLSSDYFGFNVVPADNKQTAVLGYFRGAAPFTKLVDSAGNIKYTNTNYYELGYYEFSNLTKTSNGFVLYNGYGYNNMLNYNYENLDFINDTLQSVINYSFFIARYAYSEDININYVLGKGTFFTCTSWTHETTFPEDASTNTFISRYDSNGNQKWNNIFGPNDSIIYPTQVFNSIITSDSALAVLGTVADTMQLKKYDFNGNLLFDHKYATLIYNYLNYIDTASFALIEINNNIIAFADTIDPTTNKYQLALEIVNLNGTFINQKRFILFKDTTNIYPVSVCSLSDSTVILKYAVYGSSLNYYLMLNYKGDSLGSLVLPPNTLSAFDNGNILAVQDTIGSLIVREYSPSGSLDYKYVYTPSDTLNICKAITPLVAPGRFVLTGSADNKLLIIRQDTNYINLTVGSVTNVICNGEHGGSAIVNASRGITPYTYLWTPIGGTNASESGLSAGNYILTVTDKTGNSNNALVTITQPAILNGFITTTNSNCLTSTGTIKDSAYGGTQPYTYLWSNGRTNDTLINLSSGTYTCTITDSHGCTKTESVYLDKGPTASITYTNVVCNGASTGVASVSLAGNYSYIWLPTGETNSTATGLSAGIYTVNITNIDTIGCNQIYSVTITQPSHFTASFTVTSSPCNPNQTIDAKVTSGDSPPYSYTWSYFGGMGTSVSINVNCLAGTTTDTLFVTNSKGCVSDTNVTLKSPLTWVGLLQTNESCNNGNNGSIIIEVCGGTLPYTYYWPSDSLISYTSNYTVSDLSAGTYSVAISDSTACSLSYVNITITQPSPISIISDSTIDNGGCNGSAWVHVSGGTPGYLYSWTGGLTTDSIFNQCGGYYCCTIADAHGCIDSDCITIPLFTGTNSQWIINNGQLTIYPNPNNGVFTVALSHAELVSAAQAIEIYNVLGERVETQCIASLQTTIELSNQPNGIYFYRVFDDKEILGNGKIIIEKP